MSADNEYEGGDLQLYPHSFEPVLISRDLGMLVLFRSHVLHEVTAVTKGTRYSLVTWCQGPEFR